jgi:hypothetical protein
MASLLPLSSGAGCSPPLQTLCGHRVRANNRLAGSHGRYDRLGCALDAVPLASAGFSASLAELYRTMD